MADFPVKWYSHDMEGAPVLMSLELGTVKALLQTILVTGFNQKTVDTLTYDAESGEATAEVSAGHGYSPYQIVEIAGADQSDYNGQWRVVSTTPILVRFKIDTVPESNATGPVTIKTPGAGWTMPFESGDGLRAVFKPDNDAGSQCYFYVDNTDPATADFMDGHDYDSYRGAVLVRGCESVVDIDTRGHEFGDGLITKEVADTTNDTDERRGYRVVADHRAVYINFHDSYHPDASDSQSAILAFGDLVSVRSSHRDAFIILNSPEDTDPPPSFFGDFNQSSFKRISSGLMASERDVPMIFRALVSNTKEVAFRPDPYNPVVEVSDKVTAVAYDSSTGQWVKAGYVPGLAYSLSGPSMEDRVFLELDDTLYLALRHNSGEQPKYKSTAAGEYERPYLSLFNLDSWR
ncbi:hypothetical protein [Halomonas cerina]|uniref:Uncharacterized protein n=1 Tax=Halomonas cerina TaxID=447424 RepID=A0A839VA73_9GAMM|nr:hypothetical protein [Halomonas cerina]MBB3192041.1 hypothetical protein [Halomonas cerina]